MRRATSLGILTAAAAVLAGRGAHADVAALARPDDPVLAGLIAESLAARPELGASVAAVEAARALVPVAGALPDPTLQLAVQNDGFTSIEIGSMEGSYASIAVSQTLPWPGKRGLRTALAQGEVDQAATVVQRLRLSTIAEVERGYLRLRVVRERQALLERQASLWARASEIARLAYAAGQGSQADVLRVRLEEQRLGQRRLALASEDAQALHALNRLRARPLGQPISTPGRLADGPALPALDPVEVIDDALARSPELAAARTAVTTAARAVALAGKARYPDLTVGAGVMVRGLDLPPMWQVSVAGPLPIFAARKQRPAVVAARAREVAARLEAEAVTAVLRQRILDRLAARRALAEILATYSDGLLALSQAAADSALAQYQVGKASLVTVIEASAGTLSDHDAYLGALAAAARLDISLRELSLTDDASVEPAAMTSPAMTSPAMPTAGGPRATAAPGAGDAPSTPAATSAGMGGM
ncbi:MAG: TolC family protein [Kofleriaceae bacterium]|jgi:cobalt-zinc-cadmium efflux system outer membrane protein|nr:TolC family protein [Kofleriaceae bacterium]MBP9169767.1 TolC family protein [Kofleriaceae bacterium]MBP9862220.1 TolC family protein [Kofleriaceae bacterium]